jgi:ABC-type Fe3+ transport system substrate-binding protein
MMRVPAGLHRVLVPFSALVLVLALPFVARQARPRPAVPRASERVSVLTPHNESIRFEIDRAFREHMARRGRAVEIDWRAPGGTAEITRYITSEYGASFRRYWTVDLKRPWSPEIAAALARPPAPGAKGLGAEAWQAWLASNVTCGVDLLFGGGSSEFAKHAKAGRLVDGGLQARRPELFGPGGIPQKLGGDTYWDKEGRWYGTCLSSFGVCYNRDVLGRLGINEPPASWASLAVPALTGQLALADPTKSGSVGKAFEMIVQHEMNEALNRARAAGAPEGEAVERAAVREGWAAAVRLIRRIGANARYFTDFAPRVALDVSKGEAAAGMCIDFFGRFEAEHAASIGRPGSVGFATAHGETSLDADPIGLLRGAPHRELAVELMEFVLSEEGQKIWSFRAGTPGGPERYSLRRLPILPALYEPRFDAFRSDPDERPYARERTFVYRPAWTGHLFTAIALVVRAMCVDPDSELQEAWRALEASGFPREAVAAFDDITGVDYDTVDGPLRAALQSADPLEEAHFAIALVDRHRALYKRVTELAREARGK